VSAAESEASWRDSLVRISLKYETSGVLHEGSFLHSKVIEHTEFQGVIADARGYILSYVGDHWPKLGKPQSRLVVRFSDGKSESGLLVGVDERMNVALVESTRAARKTVSLGNSLNLKRLNIVASVEDRWLKGALCPVEIVPHKLLPEKTLVARNCGTDIQALSEVGGFVFDPKGRFLGIVAGVERSGVSNSLKSYRVVPTDALNDSLRRLVDSRENLRAGYLGVYVDTEVEKVLISGVEPNTPAAEAGLIAGDVVIAVNSEPVRNLNEFGRILKWQGPGSRLELTVEREGGTKRLRPVLSPHPVKELVYGWKLELPRIWGGDSEEEQELKLSPMPLPSHLRFGLVVETLSPQLATYFKVPSGRGLLVTSVLDESLASKSGFQAGDVLVEINGRELVSPGVMREVLHAGRDGVIAVRFVRDGELQSRKLVFP
jgi:serine protease Do